MRTLILAAFLATSGAGAQSLPAGFCAQAGALIAASNAHWGVSVATLDGTARCSINANQLFRPASNAKLFTIAAALEVLGPAKTFQTRAAGKLDPATGIVEGDLYLIGGGDANLDSGDLPYRAPAGLPAPLAPGTSSEPPPFVFHDLEDLAAQLAAKGVKTVTGNLIGDDQAFPWEPNNPTWELDDLVWGYGAPVSALTIADNQFRLTVTPGTWTERSGTLPVIAIEDHGVPYYTVIDDAVTPQVSDAVTQLQVERLPGSRTLHVFGKIGQRAAPDHEEISIDDPAEYAAMVFRQVLAAHGITIQGKTTTKHGRSSSGAGFLTQLADPNAQESFFFPRFAPAGFGSSCGGYSYPPTLATHTSAPLAQDVTYTAKVSQNLHAELLLRALGSKMPCFTGSTAAGARMVRAFALNAGLSADDFLFYDGSGLSSHDLVAPRALTQLLVYAAARPWGETFKAALPIGGIDGSLASRFTGPLKGRVFAKTGSLGETRALSGYLTAASGTTLAFSVMVDEHRPDSHDDRTLMDQLVELIAAAN